MERRRKRRGCRGPRAAVLLAVASSTAVLASDVAELQRRGKLVVVTVPQQDNGFLHPRLEAGPMPKVGNATHFGGVDVDILTVAAESLGIELEIRPLPEPRYDLIFEPLLAGEGDVVAGSITITPAREARVDFTRAYYPVYEIVVVRTGSDIRSPQGIVGKTAAVMPGTSHEQRLLALGFSRAQLLHIEFTSGLYEAVATGRADFTVVDGVGAGASIDPPVGLREAFRLGEGGGFGFAVRPGSDLRPHLDALIDRLEASGHLEAILARHLEGGGATAPAD